MCRPMTFNARQHPRDGRGKFRSVPLPATHRSPTRRTPTQTTPSQSGAVARARRATPRKYTNPTPGKYAAAFATPRKPGKYDKYF